MALFQLDPPPTCDSVFDASRMAHYRFCSDLKPLFDEPCREKCMLDQTMLKTRQGLQSGPLSLNSELRFRGLLEKLPAGAYTCDPDGLITYFNHHEIGRASCRERVKR